MLHLLGMLLLLGPVQALSAFPPKIRLGDLNEDVDLQCDTAEQQVTWKLNDDEKPMVELEAKGKALRILGLDLPATGNYSCWAGSTLLDSTYVVVRNAFPPGQPSINISCQAESYRGSFHCSWRAPPFTIFRARLTRSDSSSSNWVPATGYLSSFNISFSDPSFCPFAEELHPLQLQLEGLSDTSYLNTTHSFFIRNIVRPDPPQALKLHHRRGQPYLSWAPPASWPLPKSYFALSYRLQYEFPNGNQVQEELEGAEESSLRAGAWRVRISCRDPYASPQWSPWSAWQDLGVAGTQGR